MTSSAPSLNGSKSAADMVRDYSCGTLVGMTNRQLKQIDPLIMNLLVAREIPSLADLPILRYVQTLNKWEQDIRRGIPEVEYKFRATPHDWKNDINFFRLGYVCYYLDSQIGIRYREDQKDKKSVWYTNPGDLFAHGVIDSRQGTCGNMALLHVALGWRMNWPVSLACVWSHFICRYDDGHVTHNIEATKNGGGGFHSHPDEYYIQEYKLPPQAVESGSDLRALTPREMLGVFIGLRGRHYQDIGEYDLSEVDFLLARSLFPNNRYLHFAQIMASIQQGALLFHPAEAGHPRELSDWLRHLVATEPWKKWKPKKESANAYYTDPNFSYISSGKQA